MKIPIEFPVSFETNKPGFIHIGRIYLGPFHCRLVMSPDGKIRMAVDKGAVDKGYLILTELSEETIGFGLTPSNEKPTT